MKKTDVKKYLDREFKQRLGKGVKKAKYNWIKNIGDLYMKFGYAIVDSDNSFPSSFYYGFGSPFYSNVMNHIIKIKELNIQEDKYITAISTGQIKLFDEGRYPVLEYDIYTERDANKMVVEVSEYILNNVLPPWEENPTFEYLERKVNSKINNVPNFSGLILAKLVDNPNYISIKNKLINFSKEWSEYDKKDLVQVIDFLDNNSIERLRSIGNME